MAHKKEAPFKNECSPLYLPALTAFLNQLTVFQTSLFK
ncbi:hypothetical protein KR50_23600 [Jeotgalibacillus campisalis]|uniref:Uncharacterized protein n=1 Tax=Jeotgalibacillus campisalis TaxID=220754 RepID=A0A0C2VST8_9BACL|nr:hypothetical protein KR50_23600 [Jeotgalibacillus campisalis]